jgi:hypothetical protein
MTDAELATLVAAARHGLALPADTPARAWWVYPPAGEEAIYALVELGGTHGAVGVAAVERGTGSLLSSARLPGQERHVALDEARALELAGHPAGHPRLVWAPSRQSASPLYPLWEVSGTSTSPGAVYVDLQGRTWQRLDPGGPGGGPPPDLPPSC